MSLALIFRPLAHCSPRGRDRAYKEYWHGPLTFGTTPRVRGLGEEACRPRNRQDGGLGFAPLRPAPARYARYLPKNVKIFSQPSTAAAGRYAGRCTEKKACPAPS